MQYEEIMPDRDAYSVQIDSAADIFILSKNSMIKKASRLFVVTSAHAGLLYPAESVY